MSDDNALEQDLISDKDPEPRDNLQSSRFFESLNMEDPLRKSLLIISEKNAACRSKNATGPVATLMHILKANIGIGLLSMPNAIQDAGYVLGPTLLILMGLIATHCMTLLVTCSHHLCAEMHLSALSYADVAELSIAYRFKKRYLGLVARWAVNFMLLLTQLGFCCTYIAFIAKNVILLVENSNGVLFGEFDSDSRIRLTIIIILPIFIIFSYIRSLKFLAPISSVANFCYLYAIIVILVFCFLTLAQQNGVGPDVLAFSIEPLNYPLFFGNVIFAFEGIGSVLPLENKISKPKLFQSVLWTGMFIVITLYAILGVIGYLTFGSNLEEVTSLNLPMIIQPPFGLFFPVATFYLTFGIFSSYLIQFYVPMEIIEPPFTRRVKSPTFKLLIQILIRTTVVIFTALVPIAISQINLLIDFIGACSSSCLALIFPVLIEMVTFWKMRRYRLPFYVWVIKDIIILSIGVVGGVLGTAVAIYRIAQTF